MTTSDLIIIGAGPGGYETAIEAAKAGLAVTLIEAKHLGGTCLNEGCIPTKCLAHSAEHLREEKDTLDLTKVNEHKNKKIIHRKYGIMRNVRGAGCHRSIYPDPGSIYGLFHTSVLFRIACRIDSGG